MMKLFKVLIFLILFLLFGCDRKIDLNYHEVHWDRDMCERCKMVVSDRNYAAQLTDPKTGKTKYFDDIGCVILWFKESQIDWSNQTKIWVSDEKTGKWINAREAKWTTESITPMGYGFGAYESGTEPKDKEIIDYDEVVKRVLKIGR